MARPDKASDRHDARVTSKRRIRAMDARDGTTFVAVPHVVLASAGWRRAAHTSRSFLLDLAAPLYRGGGAGEPGLPNGGLMAGAERMAAMGWRSKDVITRALRDLVACGLIVETRKGQLGRPALYAVTWHALGTNDRTYTLDIDADRWETVHRGAYARQSPAASATSPARTASIAAATGGRKAAAAARRNATPRPSHGPAMAVKGPSHGRNSDCKGPSHGPLEPISGAPAGPSHGPSLEHCHLQPTSDGSEPVDSTPVVADKATVPDRLFAIAARSRALHQSGVDPVLRIPAIDPHTALKPAAESMVERASQSRATATEP